jgi:hypothetical protein
MTYDVFLSTVAVATLLVGVAVLATLASLVLGAFGELDRSYTVPLFGCLAVIWAMAGLVIVLIRLTI